MDDVEITEEVLQAEVDVVNLTPVEQRASAEGDGKISFSLGYRSEEFSLPDIWRHVPGCGKM